MNNTTLLRPKRLRKATKLQAKDAEIIALKGALDAAKRAAIRMGEINQTLLARLAEMGIVVTVDPKTQELRFEAKR